MKTYLITYDDGYGYSHTRILAENKREARKDFKNALGSRYKIVEIEEIK